MLAIVQGAVEEPVCGPTVTDMPAGVVTLPPVEEHDAARVARRSFFLPKEITHDSFNCSKCPGSRDGGNDNVITRTGQAAFRIINVGTTGDLTLKAVTVSNGSAAGASPAGTGGGILNFGALTLTNSTISGNRAAGTGGGVQSGGGEAAVTFTGSTLTGNTAVGDGGGLYNFGTATFTSSFVDDNQGARGGGIASVDGIFSLTSTPVSTNTATVNAGGFYRSNGTLTVTTSPITNNAANNCTGSSPAVPACTG